MGAVATVAKKFVKWCGNCIERVVSWWSPHKERTNNITYNYLIGNEQTFPPASVTKIL